MSYTPCTCCSAVFDDGGVGQLWLCPNCRATPLRQRKKTSLGLAKLAFTAEELFGFTLDLSPEIVDENGNVTTFYKLAQRYRKELARRMNRDYRERK